MALQNKLKGKTGRDELHSCVLITEERRNGFPRLVQMTMHEAKLDCGSGVWCIRALKPYYNDLKIEMNSLFTCTVHTFDRKYRPNLWVV